MVCHGAACPPPAFKRPALEVADIFREHGQAYIEENPLTPDQHRALRDILACRTPALGGHKDVCKHCGYQRPSYNSCRNRHCPKCQNLAQARWIAERKRRTLPTSYVHIGFTLPAQLRPLARAHARAVFDILFEATAQTLLCLGADPNRLGALLAITCVLHTWTRDLRFHPHTHCIVSAGGLDPSGNLWVPAKIPRFLFPRPVMASLFRGKFLAALEKADRAGKLQYADGSHRRKPTLSPELLDVLYKKNWCVYAKKTFGGPQQLFDYLGRYTHKVAISNHRLISMDQGFVQFVTNGNNTVSIPAQEFIRRFLLHTLPSGFSKIRHYGLLAPSNVNTKLPQAQRLLQETHPPTSRNDQPETSIQDPTGAPWQKVLFELTGIDMNRCPVCGQGPMLREPIPKACPESHAREPPGGTCP